MNADYLDELQALYDRVQSGDGKLIIECGWPRPVLLALPRLLAELRSLRALRDAASPVAEFLHPNMSNRPDFDSMVRDLIAALDAHRAQEEA